MSEHSFVTINGFFRVSCVSCIQLPSEIWRQCVLRFIEPRTFKIDAEERFSLQQFTRYHGWKDDVVWSLTGFSEIASPFGYFTSSSNTSITLVDGKKRSCVIVSSDELRLMVAQVRNLTNTGVQAVISCYSRDEQRFALGTKSLATETNVTSSGHISRNSGPHRQDRGSSAWLKLTVSKWSPCYMTQHSYNPCRCSRWLNLVGR